MFLLFFPICIYFIDIVVVISVGCSVPLARFIGAENLTKPNIKTYIDKKFKELEDKRITKSGCN